MEGLRNAMEYLVEQSRPNFKEHEGILFADKEMHRVHQYAPVAKPFTMSTLTSLVDYIRSNTDTMRKKMLIHVESPTKVTLRSMMDKDRIREDIAVVKANVPEFMYRNFYKSEDFVIKLQAQFVDDQNDTDKALLLKYAGTTEAGTVKSYGDDGVSQSAVIQQTLSSKEEVIIPNPVTLRPYRTFHEVEQPKSQFVFRAKDCGTDVAFALFDADGGAWEIDAMENVKTYLEENLKDVDIPGVKFTIIS